MKEKSIRRFKRNDPQLTSSSKWTIINMKVAIYKISAIKCIFVFFSLFFFFLFWIHFIHVSVNAFILHLMLNMIFKILFPGVGVLV